MGTTIKLKECEQIAHKIFGDDAYTKQPDDRLMITVQHPLSEVEIQLIVDDRHNVYVGISPECGADGINTFVFEKLGGFKNSKKLINELHQFMCLCDEVIYGEFDDEEEDK